MTRAILTLTLLLALPAASEKAKQPTLEETRVMIKNLEETVEEQQERLRFHKLEIDTLQKTVSTLESRISSLEKSQR
jgi:chromosome segregation ATPase